jgi:thioredoxin-like negative regulator of GroEL
MIELSEEQKLGEHLKTHPKVIALFYASWCPFCRSFISIFNKHAQKPSQETFIRVLIDDDENPMWETFSLEAVPSIILFENGKITRRLDCELGAGLNEKQLIKFLTKT